MGEIYVSTDIESDGPIPGVNSMLSFGSAAFLPDGTMHSTFSANLETLPGAVPDPQTVEWWGRNPKAWSACREDVLDPGEAMLAYVKWLEGLPGKPVFVGYPAGYDFLFVYWYLIRFAGKSPFSFSALDIKSYAMAMLGTEFRRTAKRSMPKRWFRKHPHTHVALDDAIGQGVLFCNMLAENTAGPECGRAGDATRKLAVQQSPYTRDEKSAAWNSACLRFFEYFEVTNRDFDEIVTFLWHRLKNRGA